jgi:hypothetical protein
MADDKKEISKEEREVPVYLIDEYLILNNILKEIITHKDYSDPKEAKKFFEKLLRKIRGGSLSALFKGSERKEVQKLNTHCINLFKHLDNLASKYKEDEDIKKLVEKGRVYLKRLVKFGSWIGGELVEEIEQIKSDFDSDPGKAKDDVKSLKNDLSKIIWEEQALQVIIEKLTKLTGDKELVSLKVKGGRLAKSRRSSFFSR